MPTSTDILAEIRIQEPRTRSAYPSFQYLDAPAELDFLRRKRVPISRVDWVVKSTQTERCTPLGYENYVSGVRKLKARRVYAIYGWRTGFRSMPSAFIEDNDVALEIGVDGLGVFTEAAVRASAAVWGKPHPRRSPILSQKHGQLPRHFVLLDLWGHQVQKDGEIRAWVVPMELRGALLLTG